NATGLATLAGIGDRQAVCAGDRQTPASPVAPAVKTQGQPGKQNQEGGNQAGRLEPEQENGQNQAGEQRERLQGGESRAGVRSARGRQAGPYRVQLMRSAWPQGA